MAKAPLFASVNFFFTFIASVPPSSVHAFLFSSSICIDCNCKHGTANSSWRCSSSPTTLQMTDDQTSEDDTTAILEESSEPTLEPELDREIVELKESIASLESDLKVKKYQLEDFQIKADKFSSAGYAREVARGVNNKRTRGANNSDTKSAARAVVMQSFLPVLEELDAAGAQYQGVAFAKTFDAGIRSEFEKALNGLGVTEYTFESGQSVDTGRVVAVEEAYSEEFSKGAVIRVVKSGLEISGNVVRPAEVFVSLGSESAMEEAAAEEIGENSSGEASEECADAKES